MSVPEPSDVTAALNLLTAGVDDADVDIGAGVTALADAIRDAVASYLGLTLSIATVPPVQLIVPAVPWPVTPHTSIHLTFDGAGDVDTARPTHGGTAIAMTLYAAKPGAFVDLAADLAYITGQPLADVAVDQHLPGPAAPDDDTVPGYRGAPDAVTVAQWSAINQAVGVLIGRGSEPERAHAALLEYAAAAGLTLAAAAGVILATTSRDPTTPET